MSITREQLAEFLLAYDRASNTHVDLQNRDRTGMTLDQRLDLDIATRQAFNRQFNAHQAYTAALDQFAQQAS